MKRSIIALSTLAAIIAAVGLWLCPSYRETRCITHYATSLLQLKARHPGFVFASTSDAHPARRDAEAQERLQMIVRGPFSIRTVAGDLNAAFARHLLPFLIDDGDKPGTDKDYIHPYPGMLYPGSRDPKCPVDSSVDYSCLCVVPQPLADNAQPLHEMSQSVGRLLLVPKDTQGIEGIKDTKDTQSIEGIKDTKDTVEVTPVITPALQSPYFWGTAFVIADHMIATTCHQIESLLDEHLNLKIPDTEELVIEFGSHPDIGQMKLVDRNQRVHCGDQEGLDIALLSFKCDTCPAPLHLASEDARKPLDRAKNDDGGIKVALIGYADLEHFIDSNTEQLYRAYAKNATSGANSEKFVLPDWIVDTDQCRDNSRILLDVASTTVGQSGAILVDLGSHKVIGMHICCAEYFSDPKGTPPESDVPCAHVKRTFNNQALSMYWAFKKGSRLYSIVKEKDPKFPYL